MSCGVPIVRPARPVLSDALEPIAQALARVRLPPGEEPTALEVHEARIDVLLVVQSLQNPPQALMADMHEREVWRDMISVLLGR